jgi:hypothetical protein
MNVPGGGKNDIPNRLKRQFALFYVPLPSAAAVNSIFGALVQASTGPCPVVVKYFSASHSQILKQHSN